MVFLPSDAEQNIKRKQCDKQKAEVVEFLCQPEAATAICSAFYRPFNVPALTLTHERISKASEYNAERSLDTPNACINISISQIIRWKHLCYQPYWGSDNGARRPPQRDGRC